LAVKIAVCIKRTPDSESRFKIGGSGTGIDETGLKFDLDDFASYAVEVGRQLGLDDEDLQALHRGGYFHDIGKIALPDSILLKPGPLTPEEYDRMKEHPVIGDRLCGNLRSLLRVRPIVLCHHERQDGSGYPQRLSGDGVPLLAQIIGIVDVFDAITTTRPYHRAAAPAEAFDELRKEARAGRHSAELVEAFIQSRKTN